MNTFYYDKSSNVRVVESCYYPPPVAAATQVFIVPVPQDIVGTATAQSSLVSPMRHVPAHRSPGQTSLSKVSLSTPTLPSKSAKKGVKFPEEVMNAPTKDDQPVPHKPVFSTYLLDQNTLQPTFFRKKIQSYYHESVPNAQMEDKFALELGKECSDEYKEKILVQFQKARDAYEAIREKLHAVGLSEDGEDQESTADMSYDPEEPVLAGKKFDISAKQSCYVGMPSFAYSHMEESLGNSGYRFDNYQPAKVVAEKIEEAVPEDQYVYSDIQMDSSSVPSLPLVTGFPSEPDFQNYRAVQSHYHDEVLN
uniref:HMG box domain-containing protein n=1 Tax=Rhabditophanes sp. KR3021 TaxID=114890 RepID=A0AC35TG46_9BILA